MRESILLICQRRYKKTSIEVNTYETTRKCICAQRIIQHSGSKFQIQFVILWLFTAVLAAFPVEYIDEDDALKSTAEVNFKVFSPSPP